MSGSTKPKISPWECRFYFISETCLFRAFSHLKILDHIVYIYWINIFFRQIIINTVFG